MDEFTEFQVLTSRHRIAGARRLLDATTRWILLPATVRPQPETPAEAEDAPMAEQVAA